MPWGANTSIQITDGAFKKMMEDSEFKNKMMKIIREDAIGSNKMCGGTLINIDENGYKGYSYMADHAKEAESAFSAHSKDKDAFYEIYDEHEISATDIVNVLHVDKGYLSRILKKFETESIIVKKASETDNRWALITLTEKGKALAENLIAESNMQIAKELVNLSADDMR